MGEDKMDYNSESLGQMFKDFRSKALDNIAADYTAVHYFGSLEGKSIVDFGCGTGFSSKFFLARGASFYLGIDLNEAMIASGGNKVMGEAEYKLKRQSNSNGQACFMVEDCFKPLKQTYGQFDFAQMLFALYYCKNETDLQNYLNNALNLLKTGGKLYIGQSASVMKNLKDQKTHADLSGVQHPLKDEVGDEDPYFLQSVPAFKPAPPSVSKTGRPFTRDIFFTFSGGYCWSKEKVMENMVKAGFIDVQLLPPQFPDDVPDFEKEQIKSSEEPLMLIGGVKP